VLRGLGGNLLDVRLVHTDKDVFRLDIGVDNLALGVQIVKPLQHLFHHCFHVLQRHPLIIVSDNELE